MSPASIELLRHAVGAMADGAIVADTRTGEAFINAAAREMLGIPADAQIDTTYLKDTVGFYPFDLAAGALDGQAIREDAPVGVRVLPRAVPRLRAGGPSLGAIVLLRDREDTAGVARRRAEFAQ